jgi:6-phosphogluconolactonase
MSRAASYFAYVGARTTKERMARGNGLNVYEVEAHTGTWRHIQLLSDLINPSYLAFDRTHKFLYAVHGDLSDISAFAIDGASGKLRTINRQSTQGTNPVHLAIDPTNNFVAVANHNTSTLVLLPRQDDGSLGPVIDLVKLEGKIGPHREEQPFAKPHQVESDLQGRFIIVPDKGLDLISTYRIDAQAKKLVLASKPLQAREGAGPRHVTFHPSRRFAYVVNELDSTVSAHHYDPETGALQTFQVISTLPDTFTGNSRASEIAISSDGRFVYASNRGHNSVAVFSVNASDGRLMSVGWPPTGGNTPRFFALDPNGDVLFAANEDSDTIVPFTIDKGNGLLTRKEPSLQIGSPVCILFRI